ncbi:MAG: M48 family metalloprotease [Dialister sp.]
MNHLTKKVSLLIMSGILGSSFAFSMPLISYASADAIGILGTVVGGALVYRELDDYMNRINNTEEGRQEYFNELKKKEGVSENYARKARLDAMMSRLTEGVASSDPSIYEKPYLYFLNPKPEFNAACGLGHVLTINEGIFDLSGSEDEIAVVLAHEMGHGQKDHVVKGTKKKIKTIIGASVASGALGGTALSNMAMTALVGQINNVQITKKQEWEADNLAFDYCYQSGYNPGAGAALWQRVLEKKGEFRNSLLGEIFSPSDHPTHEERRDNYEKRLKKLSGGHVSVKKNTDTVQVNKKDFITPAPANGMSSAERKYFVMGNLAASYHQGKNNKKAYALNGTVMLGDQNILTPVREDPSAEELADLLNKIK